MSHQTKLGQHLFRQISAPCPTAFSLSYASVSCDFVDRLLPEGKDLSTKSHESPPKVRDTFIVQLNKIAKAMLEQTKDHNCGRLGAQDASAQRHNFPAALADRLDLLIGPAAFRTY